MTRDEAIAGLAATSHFLLGYALGVPGRVAMTTGEAWTELKPYRRHIVACCRALGISTLEPPYLDPEDDLTPVPTNESET